MLDVVSYYTCMFMWGLYKIDEFLTAVITYPIHKLFYLGYIHIPFLRKKAERLSRENGYDSIKEWLDGVNSEVTNSAGIMYSTWACEFILFIILFILFWGVITLTSILLCNFNVMYQMVSLPSPFNICLILSPIFMFQYFFVWRKNKYEKYSQLFDKFNINKKREIVFSVALFVITTLIITVITIHFL